MAQKTVESKVGESGSGNIGLSNQGTQPPVAVKKTPLRDMQNDSNIIAPKTQGILVLKEAVVSETAKVSGVKRPSPEMQMSPPQQHPACSNGSNGHLVYVRRKFEAEAGKGNHNEVILDASNSSQPKQLGHQEDRQQPKPLSEESPVQCSHAHAPIPTASLMSVPCAKPSIPASQGNSSNIIVSEELQTQSVRFAVTSSVQPRVNKPNWEERYLQLQMHLKTLDQSSLEDHLQMLRSLSAAELNKHAVELEKRAIQLSLEQGKELHRVKALNVLGKAMKASNGPPVSN